MDILFLFTHDNMKVKEGSDGTFNTYYMSDSVDYDPFCQRAPDVWRCKR